jgi:hypothetical protein
MRGGELAQEGTLSRVGITYQTRIGYRSKFQGKPALLTGNPIGRLTGCSIPRALEVGVSFATAPAQAENELHARLKKVSEGLEFAQVERSPAREFVAVRVRHVRMKFLRKPKNHRPDRHFHDQGFSVPPVLVLALSMPASFCTQVRLVIERREIIGVRVGFENDAAAVTAVATVGSPARNKLFPSKAAATIAAISRLRMDANMVDEFHFVIRALEAQEGRFRTSASELREITSF